MAALWIVSSLYGALHSVVALAAWRSGTIRRGAGITMLAGGVLLVAGSVADWRGAGTGLWLAAGGLLLISDSALATGSQRPGGPRWSHHVVRGVIGVALWGGLWLG